MNKIAKLRAEVLYYFGRNPLQRGMTNESLLEIRRDQYKKLGKICDNIETQPTSRKQWSKECQHYYYTVVYNNKRVDWDGLDDFSYEIEESILNLKAL